MLRIAITIVYALLLLSAYSQRGKDAAVSNIASLGTVVNTYTNLSANVSAGAFSIQVNNNALNGGAVFTSPLNSGDLIFIIQMKGATLNAFPIPISATDTLGFPNDATLGAINSYNNCGNYEFAEVRDVSGGSTINLRCALQNDYSTSGTVQVIRVPRFGDLTVSAGASIIAPVWDGFTGGAVIIEVDGDLTLNGTIDVDALGFRGGTVDNTSLTFAGQHAGTNPAEGARKGEGIAGYDGSYSIWGGMYGRGAFANAGGGGTAHNAGGGGGGNAAPIAWNNGLGNPDVSGGAGWVAAWNLEATLATPTGLISTTVSGGGGRGGYTWSDQNQNATTVAPENGSWSGDNRRVQGGLGGRPLDYTTGKIFFGGGGGAGEMNDNEGGNGGRGGGLVYAKVYGTISGSGSVEANGEDGESSVGPTPGFGQVTGKDGAGGGGAGGTVLIEAVSNISGISINVDGGNGGDQTMQLGAFGNPECQGPGGGGGGGYLSTSASTATMSANAGSNGITTSPDLSEFTPNGATAGSDGLTNTSIQPFGVLAQGDTICGGGATTLSLTTYGTIPGGTLILWYNDLGTTIVGSGTTFSTGVLTSDTTFYVGLCPGDNLIPVSVLVPPGPSIDTSSIVLSDENCSMVDGSITGIAVAGGPYTFDWNGSSSVGTDLTNVPAGNYTLTVTDTTGCSSSMGPVTLNNIGGPTIDATNILITNESCGNQAGSITGITASGSSLTYSWNGSPTIGVDTVNLGAGSYTLTVIDGSGCTATSGPHVVGNIGAPTIDTTGISILDETCSSGNGEITGINVFGGTGSLSYQWNGSTSSGPDTLGLAGGSYTLVVTDGVGCSSSMGPVVVADLAAPVIDVSLINIVDENCGQSDGGITGITVTGSPVLNYSWNASVTPTADLLTIGAGSYTLTVTDGNSCVSNAGPFVVASYTGPTIDSTNHVLVDESCFGNDGTISGITASGLGTLSYTWNGTGSSTIDTTNLVGGTYTLIVTDSTGCTASSGPYTVVTNLAPTIDDSNILISDENCGNVDGSITGIIASGGTGVLSFDWNAINASGTDTVNLSSGSYTLTVTDAAGCIVSGGPYVVGGTLPVNVSVSGPLVICEGQSTTLTATGASLYNWSSGGATNIEILSPVVDTNYSVIGSTGPCSDTTTVFITVNPLPTANIVGDTSICFGESTVLQAFGGSSYLWSTTDITGSISVSPSVSTVYNVVASNICGNDTASATVTVNSLPNANAGVDQSILVGGSTPLSASGGNSYNWSPSTGLDCSNCQSPTASPTSTTTYIVVVTDANGCVRSDTVVVFVDESNVLYVPNVFSPNGDLQNDVLFVRGGGIAELEFRIYDRWGELVFVSDDMANGWDGTFKGENAVQGVYVYALRAKYYDGSTVEKTGNITLIR